MLREDRESLALTATATVAAATVATATIAATTIAATGIARVSLSTLPICTGVARLARLRSVSVAVIAFAITFADPIAGADIISGADLIGFACDRARSSETPILAHT